MEEGGLGDLVLPVGADKGDLDLEKARSTWLFMRRGRNRRQDHGTRDNSDRRLDWDDPEDKVLLAARRDRRHGSDEIEE